MTFSNIISKRPIGTLMIFISLVVFGFISLSRLQVSLLPEVNYPKLTVITIYQNIPPTEMKNLVTSPIEETLMSVKGVKRVESISRQGVSIVTPVFNWGTNLDIASVDVREKLDMIQNILPNDVLKPIISRIDPSSTPVMGIGIFWEADKTPVFIKTLSKKRSNLNLKESLGLLKYL